MCHKSGDGTRVLVIERLLPNYQAKFDSLGFLFLILECQDQFSYLHESQRFRFFYFRMILIEWCIPERTIQR